MLARTCAALRWGLLVLLLGTVVFPGQRVDPEGIQVEQKSSAHQQEDDKVAWSTILIFVIGLVILSLIWRERLRAEFGPSIVEVEATAQSVEGPLMLPPPQDGAAESPNSLLDEIRLREEGGASFRRNLLEASLDVEVLQSENEDESESK